MNDNNHTPSATPQAEPPRRKSTVRTILKVTGFTLLGIIILITALLGVAAWYLTPERLTPLIEREANSYLRGEVKIGRVDISIFSTFPRFNLQVDSLRVRTAAFDSLPAEIRDRLPRDADRLLSVDEITGTLNILKLLAGTIDISRLYLTNPWVNIVQATPETGSLDIFPPSEEKDDKGPVSIPDISLTHFTVDSALMVSYFSLPDTIDARLTLNALQLDEEGSPAYALNIEGVGLAKLPSMTLPDTRIGLDGGIDWTPREPLALGLREFGIAAGNVNLRLDTSIDFADTLTVESLTLRLPDTPAADIIALIPPEYTAPLDKLTDPSFTIGLDAILTRPYRPAEGTLPSFDLNLRIPAGRVAYDGMRVDKIFLAASASVDGADPDASQVHIERLAASGDGIEAQLSGDIVTPLSDPTVSGRFEGSLDASRLPKSMLSMLPGPVKGVLRADCSFDLRRSWLNRENFHRIRVKGDASLDGLDVNMPAIPIEAYARRIDLKFGTSGSFTRGTLSVDSLLTASLKADTLSLTLPGMDMNLRDLAAGVGCKNTGSSSDTTQINPIGARVTVGHIYFHSEADSIRVAAQKASVGASLTRFKGDVHKPRLSLGIDARRAFYSDGATRAMLTEAHAGVTVHPSTSAANTRRLARMDSLRRLYPTLSRDSLEVLARTTRSHARRRVASDSIPPTTDNLDLEVDGSIRRLLRRWEAAGRLSAAKVMAFTPSFPLRSRITDLNMRFTTDSITLTETHIRAGHSDFRVNGTISNISRALTSRNGSQALRVRLDLMADTINVNEIAGAVFAGAAYGETAQGDVAVETPLEATDDSSFGPAQTAATDSSAVLVVPANLDARLNITAANIVYSDIAFRNFRGVLNAFDGALNLSQLAASTDVGSLSLNALYSAHDRKSASFAFGLGIKDFRIAEFLDLIPAVDSLMPMMNGIRGVINADLAATTDIGAGMNFDIPSLKAALRISGDSLVVVDDATYRKVGKWLLFKDKNHNMIDSMSVQMIIDNSQLRMFPFVFNLDRYRLGVTGYNDMALNLNYHVAVLKSPIPFKFGINLSGNPDNLKVRLGRARFSEKDFARTVTIADTTRINLVNEIGNVFRRGVRQARMKRLDFTGVDRNLLNDAEAAGDTISHADSLFFIREGVLPAPPEPLTPPAPPTSKKTSRK